MGWEPFLDGAAARPYRAFVEEVVDSFTRPDREVSRNPTLWLGCAGEALALHHLGRFLGRDVDGAVATLVEEAVTQLNDGVGGEGLFLGPVGVGLVLAWLADELPFDCTDAIGAIDDLVAGHLEEAGDGKAELFTGLAGDAFYALQRADEPRLRAALSTFLTWLEARAVRDGAGARWMTQPHPQYAGKYGLPADRAFVLLGAAHGVPGIAAVLDGIARAGVDAARARALRDDAWRFVLGSARATGASRFPVGRVDGEPFGALQLSWCKGDPGVLGAAVAAGAWSAAELAPLVDSAAAACLALGDDGDRGLCCGDAGRGLLFHFVSCATGLSSARAAADDALARALTRPPAPGGISLCSGSIGVALAFASVLSAEPPAWSSVMGMGLSPLGR